MLIASPEHVRWVRTPEKFSLRTLGARPVDFSDPPGGLDRTWRSHENPDIPWFALTTARFFTYLKLVELRGKLDVGHYTATPVLNTFMVTSCLLCDSSNFQCSESEFRMLSTPQPWLLQQYGAWDSSQTRHAIQFALSCSCLGRRKHQDNYSAYVLAF